MSKTISVTLPDQLEEELQNKADNLGISRSRFIGNILLDWQKKLKSTTVFSPNTCDHQKDGFCSFFGISCAAPVSEAVTCEGYIKKEN